MAHSYLVDDPQHTWFDFKRFLGELLSWDEFDRIKNELIYHAKYRSHDGRLNFPIEVAGQTFEMIPKQLLAIYLDYLNNLIADKSDLQSKCVIGVPLCYTREQRHALISACQIAGLDCIELLNETTAIGITYTLTRMNLPAPSAPSNHVAFVSIGYMHTQVAVCAINVGRLQILSTAYDAQLGGYHVDAVLRELILNKLYETCGKEETMSNLVQTNLSLLIPKLKETMSSAKDIIIQANELFPGEQKKIMISRHLFKTEMKKLLDRIEAVSIECLKASGLKINQVDSVELIGGTCRIAEIANTIQTVFEQEGRWSRNSKEVVANGCAFRALLYSKHHSVSIEVDDSGATVSEQQIREWQRCEKHLTELENANRMKLERQRNLEAYLVELKNKTFQNISEAELQKYKQTIIQYEDQIKSDQFTASEDEYNRVSTELNSLVQNMVQLSQVRKELNNYISEIQQQLVRLDTPLKDITKFATDIIKQMTFNNSLVFLKETQTHLKNGQKELQTKLNLLSNHIPQQDTGITSLRSNCFSRETKVIDDATTVSSLLNEIIQQIDLVQKAVLRCLLLTVHDGKLDRSFSERFSLCEEKVNRWKDGCSKIKSNWESVRSLIFPSSSQELKNNPSLQAWFGYFNALALFSTDLLPDFQNVQDVEHLKLPCLAVELACKNVENHKNYIIDLISSEEDGQHSTKILQNFTDTTELFKTLAKAAENCPILDVFNQNAELINNWRLQIPDMKHSFDELISNNTTQSNADLSSNEGAVFTKWFQLQIDLSETEQRFLDAWSQLVSTSHNIIHIDRITALENLLSELQSKYNAISADQYTSFMPPNPTTEDVIRSVTEFLHDYISNEFPNQYFSVKFEDSVCGPDALNELRQAVNEISTKCAEYRKAVEALQNAQSS